LSRDILSSDIFPVAYCTGPFCPMAFCPDTLWTGLTVGATI